MTLCDEGGAPVWPFLGSLSLWFPLVVPAPSCLWCDVHWAGSLRCGPGTEGLQHGRWRKLPSCPLCPGACPLWWAMTACDEREEEILYGQVSHLNFLKLNKLNTSLYNQLITLIRKRAFTVVWWRLSKMNISTCHHCNPFTSGNWR